MKPANFAPVYAALYPKLAEICRKYGWALAAHGSMARDFDVIAIPWADHPESPQAIVDEILQTFAIEIVSGWVDKPHSRRAILLSIMGECQFDLQFMPLPEPVLPKPVAEGEAHFFIWRSSKSYSSWYQFSSLKPNWCKLSTGNFDWYAPKAINIAPRAGRQIIGRALEPDECVAVTINQITILEKGER